MNRPARILYAHASSLIGGANKVLLRIVAGLDRSRFAPVSVIPDSGPMEAELRRLDVPYFILDLRACSQSRLAQAASLLRLSLRSMRIRPGLMHANELPYRSAALGTIGSKRICHIHHPGSTAEGLRWLLRRVPELIITPSHFVRREVLDCLAASGLHVPVEAVWNPIDLDWFRPATDRDAARSRLGMNPADRHITIIGSLAPHKGHECFLKMASQIAAGGPETRFHILGSDMGRHAEYAQSLRRLSAELGLSDRVKFWGYVDDQTARDILATSDLFVLPSTEEGFGLVLAEAQACGVPVLATAIEPLGEVVDDGRTGYLLPADQPAAFAEKARRLLDSPQQCAAMGEAGRHWVEERFSCGRYVERITSLYEQVLAASRHEPLPSGACNTAP